MTSILLIAREPLVNMALRCERGESLKMFGCVWIAMLKNFRLMTIVNEKKEWEFKEVLFDDSSR